jgi:hypothetical protein
MRLTRMRHQEMQTWQRTCVGLQRRITQESCPCSDVLGADAGCFTVQRKEKIGLSGYDRRVGWMWVTKIIRFGRNALQIVIVWYFIVLPPYPLPEPYDGWILREG